MAEQRRSDRLAKQLRSEIAALIRDELDDPRIGELAVTGIRLSKDLGHARVYVHSLDDRPGRRKELLKGLESARGFLRRALSQRLAHLRKTPDLTFVYDTSLDAGTRVEELLAEIESGE